MENYYATAFESHQDGLAEAGINSVFTLARSGMAQSGLGGKYWFVQPRMERIAETSRTRKGLKILHGDYYMVRRKTYQSSDRLDAGHGCI